MTSWEPAPRTDTALAVIAAAEKDRVEHPELFAFDVDSVAERAAGERGDGDFAPGWRSGLEAYLASAESDGRLNALGNRIVIETAISRLRAGASLRRHVAADESLEAQELLPPIVIVGGWRTGTTFLFRLLGTDARLRAPLPSELTRPLKIAALRGDEREAALDAASASHEFLHAINPELRSVHDSGARLPEECVLAMGSDLRNWGFTSTTRLDGYARWLAGQDLSPTYRLYRDQLKVLDHVAGRRWVLKAPAHTAELDSVVETFPGAVVVHLHRDIVETVASGASLFATFRAGYSDEVDPVDVGEFHADQTHLWFERAMTLRRSGRADQVTWIDVAYSDLIADPVGVVSRIWNAVDLEPLADPAGFIDTYRRSHPRHGHGRHQYSPEDFGLDPVELRERFADYVEFAAERCT